MGTKNLYENGPNPFFFIRDQKFQKNLVTESNLWQRLCFGTVSTTSLSMSMRGRYNNKIAE